MTTWIFSAVSVQAIAMLDEFIHANLCSPFETWLHSVLFVLHPIVLSVFGLAWWIGSPIWIFQLQLALTLTFAIYQVVYWSRA